MSKQQSKSPIDPPEGWLSGLVPTLNDTGFMFEVLDNFVIDFTEYSGKINDEVLELGCAYGVATLRALEQGARVRACDIDERHLEILRSRTPEEHLDKLSTEIQRLPEANLPDEQFGAILCSRVFHFLTGDEIDASLAGMFRWLKPGGRVYLIADTPYGIWRNFIPEWEANIKNGERWPGFMEPMQDYLPYTPRGQQLGPPFMNLMSPEILSRACTEAGFSILQADWISREDFSGSGRMDGRENCGIIAVKPES